MKSKNYKIWSITILVFFYFGSYGQMNEPAVKMALPDPLISNSGKKISDRNSWMKNRRGEILTLFEDNLYGQLPKDFDSIRFKLKPEDKMAMNGEATLKEIAINVYRNNQLVTINLLLFIPSKIKKPCPVFLLINHRPKGNTDVTRSIKSEFWPAEEVIKRGYAIAAFNVSDVAADNKQTYDREVLRLYPEQLKIPNGMKAISAWAWGAMRVMDYFEKDKSIDNSKVAVIGHSRGGKAALWAGAQDKRFALTISSCSGEGGAALSRHLVGETIQDLNANFPHWFCDNYKNYNTNVNALPMDQHMLIALLAPRAVYVASASNDSWADPLGEFLAIKFAEPVYKLFGLKPLPVIEQPAINTSVTSLQLGYHVRKGVHDLTLYDWEKYMDFAAATGF